MPVYDFRPFSNEHFITLAIGIGLATGLIIFARKSLANQRRTTALLAFLNLAAFPLALLAWRDYPKALDNILPFHLCDLTAIIAGFALITRKPVLCTLTYFWGLAGTVQALLTPAITIGPPQLPFIHFFIQHFTIVATALYLPIVLGWRPKRPWWRSPVEVFAISIVYQGTALLINLLLKTNFAFASRPPDNPSLIDHLGPWPIYLFVLQAIALILYFLLTLPFAGKTSAPAE
ncbi:MAG: TIGR02206 family membrane protein [Armatimonadetes bacterium]|nr:TIGR02206 family membrane protein [Akkermansiaceae bacterium]